MLSKNFFFKLPYSFGYSLFPQINPKKYQDAGADLHCRGRVQGFCSPIIIIFFHHLDLFENMANTSGIIN